MEKGNISLFEKISDFSANVISDLIVSAQRKWGPEACRQPCVILQLIPLAEAYFNHCAHWISNREEEYINDQFDAMAKLGPGIHRMHLLQFAVILTLDIFGQINVCDIIWDDREETARAVRNRARELMADKQHLAVQLVPCQHKHEPLKPGEKPFNFQGKPLIQTDKGLVPMTTLQI